MQKLVYKTNPSRKLILLFQTACRAKRRFTSQACCAFRFANALVPSKVYSRMNCKQTPRGRLKAL